jgi:hypothetical protein
MGESWRTSEIAFLFVVFKSCQENYAEKTETIIRFIFGEQFTLYMLSFPYFSEKKGNVKYSKDILVRH